LPINLIQCGKVILGKNATIGNNVTLGHREDGVVVIGENAVIRSGCIIYSQLALLLCKAKN
jgi:serine acetyltransferase